MSDPEDFEGGELQVRLYGDFTPPMKKGTVIAFPSILQHQVTPVTKGVRYTATMWISGPRFK
jgi:PKHD-type hydroxylase